MRNWLGFLLALLAPLTSAIPAEEYDISADRMSMVDGRFTFTGEVVVSGESLNLEADKIVVDNGEYVVSGSPARLVYKERGDLTSVTGTSIEYSEAKDSVELTNGGSIVRGALRVDAGKISYDLAGRLLNAAGGVSFEEEDISASADSASSSGSGDSILLKLSGKPAMIDVPGRDGLRLQASASIIEYDQVQGVVRLLGEAVANLGRESLRGEEIDYDINSGSFTAEPSENGRVHATIQAP